jgi:tRNA-specific 2-thiouridylase
VLGRHDGIARYTVGQGRRLGSATFDGGQRQVVVALDAHRRRVVVGPRDTGSHTVLLREVNWLSAPTDVPVACDVKLRARETPHPATVVLHAGGTATVRLEEAALAAPGQACVMYRGSRVLGGGMICRGQIDANVEPRLTVAPST